MTGPASPDPSPPVDLRPMSDDEAFKILRACQRYFDGEGSFQAAIDAIKGAAAPQRQEPPTP